MTTNDAKLMTFVSLESLDPSLNIYCIAIRHGIQDNVLDNNITPAVKYPTVVVPACLPLRRKGAGHEVKL
jgi:hypothetical protein